MSEEKAAKLKENAYKTYNIQKEAGIMIAVISGFWILIILFCSINSNTNNFLKIIGKEVKNAQQNNGLTINIPMLFSKPYIVAPFLGLLLFLLAILLLILSSSVCYAAQLQYENTIQLIDSLTNSSIKYPAQISKSN